MIITCEACGTSFKIKTSLIKETGSTVRCSKCQQVFIAYPPEDEKATDFSVDESLESKIDDFLGTEFDDEFSDLESEISLETAEITMSTSEELFATADAGLDETSEAGAEPEILLSELEQDDDTISMDDLTSGPSADADVELGELLADDDESEVLSFDNFTGTEEEISFDTLESTADQDEDTLDLESMVSDELVEEEVVSDETIESEEEEIDFLDFGAEAVQPDAETMSEKTAEPEEIMEGGVDTDLDEFDLAKEPEKEDDTSEGTAKQAGKMEAEAEKPAEELSKSGIDKIDEDEFELDLDLETEPEAETDQEEFDLDLDLDVSPEARDGDELALDEDDLDLDLDGFEDLDLTESSSESATAEEDLSLDIASTSGTDEDLGLDLDLDEFDDLDLDLDLGGEEAASAADAGEEADFDLDLDLDLEEDDDVAEAEPATAVDDEFDLDFDLEEEGDEKEAAELETFDLDLSIEPEPEAAAEEEFDLDLDFDDELSDASSGEAETFTDDETAAASEEFDLTQIEDVLDFDETPEPEEVKAETVIEDLEMELEKSDPGTISDDDEMSIDLETMLDEEGHETGDKKEVSLETVEEREQQIEQDYRKTVVEERERSEVPGNAFTGAAAADAAFEEPVRPAEPAAAKSAKTAGKKQSVKKILIPLILLIVLGGLVYVGVTMFTGEKDAPVPPPPAATDQGNLQMEMIATPSYQFVENEAAGELLVITGTVTNRYDHPRSNILVKGTLYDAAGKVIVTSTAYTGNMLTDAELATLELDLINERLNNRTGDDNLNVDIAPGKEIPFTVVFANLPENMHEFTVEVVQSAR
jgi:predicted Zn finger-like uncharacterized protein